MGEDEVQGPHHSESRVPAGCHLPGLFVTSQGRPRLSATTLDTCPFLISVHGNAPSSSILTTWFVTSRKKE